MKYIYITPIIIVFACFSKNDSVAQCAGGSNGGSLGTPVDTWNTRSVVAGNYYTFTADACDTYIFSFCQGGGGSTFDTQITLRTNTDGGVTDGYNDDVCGYNAELVWSPEVDGTYRVLIAEYNCSGSGKTGTLAFRRLNQYCTISSAKENPVFGTNCVQLTPNQQGRKGCTWSKSGRINLSAPFDYESDIFLGTNNATGADGITFSFHNDPNGYYACGASGGELGMGGVSPSWIVEVDTWNNAGYPGDIPEDHIAISINGNIRDNQIAGPVQASATNANVEDGMLHNLRVVWDPATQDFSVYFDGVHRLTHNYDIINDVFGGEPSVYWGFTASTGLYTNEHYFCPINLPMPVAWTKIDFECHEKGTLTWTTVEEFNNDHFLVLGSDDGSTFTELNKTTGAGNTSTATTYKWNAENNIFKYYKIKQVDINGSHTYSPVIENTCATSSKLNITYNSKEIHIRQSYAETLPVEIMIYDEIGRMQVKNVKSTSSGEICTVDVSHLPQGLYLIKAVPYDGEHQTFKALFGF